MCGLSGSWGFAPESAAALGELAEAMARAVAHRGPDDSGTWVDGQAGLALGHRRLAVIDLSPHGHQPMVSADGRRVLVYNGEIYNYRELRADLEARGVRFRGASDTEVLLEALGVFGVEDTLARCVGMFAWALWDREQRVLTLARDRLGIKPLYAGFSGGTFLFGSELKALRAHPGFRPELDLEALALYLRHGYVPAPRSIYRGIAKLEPGCWMAVHADRRVESHRWWDAARVAALGREKARRLSQAGDAHDAREALERLEAVLRRAVSDRRVADVPLGAFLSGGIDSSTVVALLAEESGSAVRTFTIGFEEDAFDESAHARRVAEQLGTEHHDLFLSGERARSIVPRLAQWWDEPFADSSQIPTWHVAELARREVTVCLSGDGGDELFGGYDRYWRALGIERALRALPRPLRRPLGAGLERARLAAAFAGSRAERRARTLGRLFAADEPLLRYRELVSHWRDASELVRGAPGEPVPDAFREPAGALEPIQTMMLADLRTYLPDDILCKVDRATMAHGLEGRVPLLDHRVVELAWSLPVHVAVGPAPGKAALRRILGRRLPAELFERPKQGFGVPISSWLRGPLRGWCEELLAGLARDGVLESEPVLRLWREHLSGRRDWGYHLWDVLAFQAWYERWMR